MEKFQLFKILIDKKDENAFRSNYLQKKVYFLNDTGQIKMDFFLVTVHLCLQVEKKLY